MRKLPIVLLVLTTAAPVMGQIERPAISPKPGMCLIQNIISLNMTSVRRVRRLF